MADEVLNRDANHVPVAGAVTDDANEEVRMLRIDDTTKALKVKLVGGGGFMENPMTTGGDIIYGGASGVPTRLANGTSGQVLTSNGTTLAPSWQTVGGGLDSVTVTLTQSDINNLHTTPITLIAAQGANTLIVPIGIVYYYNYGTSAFTGTPNLSPKYNGVNDNAFQNFGQITGTSDYIYQSFGTGVGMVSANQVNLPITIVQPDGAIGGGSGSTVTVTAYYDVLTLS